VSSATQAKRSWTARYYDKIILVVVLLLLLGSVAWLMMRIGRETQLMAVSGGSHTPGPAQLAPPVSLEPMDETRLRLDRPFQAGASSNWAFASELRVACVACAKPIPYRAVECPICGAAQPEKTDERKVDSDGDGMPDWYEAEHRLNPHDPGDAALDSDGDGFSNVEEFLAGTSPTNPAEFPAMVSKLRFERVQRQPFRLRFLAINKLTETEVRYQLNLRTMDRTYFAALGDVVEGYTVASFEKLEDGREVLTLMQDERKVRLEKGKVYSDEQLLVALVSLIDKQPIRTRINGTFRLRDGEYVVRSAAEDGVRIESVTTGKTVVVPRLSPQEDAALKGETLDAPEPAPPR